MTCRPLAIGLAAVTALVAERPLIRSSSNVVLVPVSVTDSSGAPVLHLGAADFEVYEDGVRQIVRTVSIDEAPVSVSLVLDASRSMEAKMASARDGVRDFVARAVGLDEFQLVRFNDDVRLVCPWTTDTDEVELSLARLTPSGWTSLHDGMIFAASRFRQATHPKRVLVVLSDGADNYSRYDARDVSTTLAESDATVYAIALSSGELFPTQARILNKVARETGGWTYRVRQPEQLREAIETISRVIHSRYVIEYVPLSAPNPGKFHKIEVRLRGNRSGYFVSWRRGYIAPDTVQ